MNDAPRYATLRDYLRVLFEQRWLIAAIALIAAAVAFLVGLAQQPTYEATAAISYEEEEDGPGAAIRASTDPRVAKRVQESLATEAPPSELEAAITPTAAPGLMLINLTATWDDPEFATELADEYGREIVAHVNEEARTDLEEESDALLERLEAVPSSQPEERASLQAEAERLRLKSENTRPLEFFERPQQPQTQGAGRLLRNAGIGLALGLLIGIALALLRAALDRRMRGVRQVEAELELPLLGFVGRGAFTGPSRRWRRQAQDGTAAELEAFRLLRKNVEVLRDPPRIVLVTSARAEEGKSTVAAGLARVFAMSSRRTLLLECDLRRPALAERLGLEPSPGLTDMLAGEAKPADAIQEIESDPGRLACITAGTPSKESAELLASSRFRELLQELSGEFDVTVVDGGALLPVVDTRELLPLTDVVLLCVRTAWTTLDEGRAAKATLERFADGPCGVVVTGLRRGDERFAELEGYGSADASSSSTIRRSNPSAV